MWKSSRGAMANITFEVALGDNELNRRGQGLLMLSAMGAFVNLKLHHERRRGRVR